MRNASFRLITNRKSERERERVKNVCASDVNGVREHTRVWMYVGNGKVGDWSGKRIWRGE